jgi:hypothetical protein
MDVGVVVDVEKGGFVSLDSLKAWEARHGKIPRPVTIFLSELVLQNFLDSLSFFV